MEYIAWMVLIAFYFLGVMPAISADFNRQTPPWHYMDHVVFGIGVNLFLAGVILSLAAVFWAFIVVVG